MESKEARESLMTQEANEKALGSEVPYKVETTAPDSTASLECHSPPGHDNFLVIS